MHSLFNLKIHQLQNFGILTLKSHLEFAAILDNQPYWHKKRIWCIFL